MNGILNIDKPAGMTSHDVVGRIRRLARIKRVGHAGTLDPDATGVLLVCLGPATRLADYLAAQGKEYRATLVLGCTTTTEDASGAIVSETDAFHITEADLRAVLPRFLGQIEQVPPMVSAVHHEGRRLYQLAREGITVERQARPVQIDALTVRDFSPGSRAQAILEVSCGKGTYIRTLCADLGAALGVGGMMGDLRRTRAGRFDVADAIPLDLLREADLPGLLHSPSAALSDLPAQVADDAAARDAVAHGRVLTTILEDAPVVRVVDAADALLALARAEGGRLHPFAVFPTEAGPA